MNTFGSVSYYDSFDIAESINTLEKEGVSDVIVLGATATIMHGIESVTDNVLCTVNAEFYSALDREETTRYGRKMKEYDGIVVTPLTEKVDYVLLDGPDRKFKVKVQTLPAVIDMVKKSKDIADEILVHLLTKELNKEEG